MGFLTPETYSDELVLWKKTLSSYCDLTVLPSALEAAAGKSVVHPEGSPSGAATCAVGKNLAPLSQGFLQSFICAFYKRKVKPYMYIIKSGMCRMM